MKLFVFLMILSSVAFSSEPYYMYASFQSKENIEHFYIAKFESDISSEFNMQQCAISSVMLEKAMSNNSKNFIIKYSCLSSEKISQF